MSAAVRRKSSVSDIFCPLGARERIACDDVKAALGIDSDANLIRTALYNLTEFALGKSHVDIDLFRLRAKAGKRDGRRGKSPKQLTLKETA